MFIVIWLSVFWIQNCQSISTDELLSVMDELHITNPYVYHMKNELGSVHAFKDKFPEVPFHGITSPYSYFEVI